MSLEQYLVPVCSHVNICFDCANACGGCSWSGIDPKTGRPRFQPVPGWTAEKVLLNVGTNHGRRDLVETYHITACPLFVDDTNGRKETGDGTDTYRSSLRTFY